MLAVRGVLTAFAVLWLLWLAHALTTDSPLSHAVHDYAQTHWIKQARQRAEDRAIRERNRRADIEAGEAQPDDYRAPSPSGN
ncbi:MAG: hypothetical protein KGL48_01685 [Sphingomonadales bacterium]|nr:hypothetical protein [Sphingomonadales bacterium]MDE2569417.1 hypothetical protein [Sphingomonadales bacterium]